MKKLYLLFLLIVATFGAQAQILEHNNAIRKNLKNTQMEVMKSYYTEQSGFVRDTSGDAMFRNQKPVINTTSDDSLLDDNEVKKLNLLFKNKQITVEFKDAAIRDIRSNRRAKVVKDSVTIVRADHFQLCKTTTFSIDTMLMINNNLELSILQLIESIRMYKSKLDSTKYISSKGELADSIVYLLSNLTLMNSNREHLEVLELDSRRKILRYAEKIENNDLSVVSKVDELIKDIEGHKGELVLLKMKVKIFDSTWGAYFTKYVKNKPAKPVDVAALPFFSTIPGMKDINGSINIIGSSVINDTGSYIEFGLFTGVLKSSDSTNAYNVLISEVSNYAFYFKWNYGFESIAKSSAKRIALNSELFYANKAIGKDSSLGVNSNFNSSVFHGKLGIEFLVIKDLLSGYVNGNALVAVTNKQLFDKRFKSNSDILGYPDFGFKMLMSANMKMPDGLKLYFDLNFLVNTDELKNFNSGSNDILIPNFRVGLRANLGNL
jgi:hypothetical protein